MIPQSARISFLYLERGRLRMDGAVPTFFDKPENSEEIRETPIPDSRLACLLLGPGTSVSQDAVKHLADAGCLMLWVGESGVRVYAAGKPGGASGVHLLHQAGLLLSPERRFQSARMLYTRMMGKVPPERRSIDQLRGLEGVWVRNRYAELAKLHGVSWGGRNQKLSDPANRAISMATSTLYGVTEAAILALGYSPALGIIHQGDSRSFVFDIADTVKFRTVVPLAFEMAASFGADKDLSGKVRRACRDLFVREKMLELLVDIIQEILGDAVDGD